MRSFIQIYIYTLNTTIFNQSEDFRIGPRTPRFHNYILWIKSSTELWKDRKTLADYTKRNR